MKNTLQTVDAYLSSLTDSKLKEFCDTAYKDTCEAGNKEKDSEWHQNCFAAFYLACTEMNKRKGNK